MNAFLVVVFLAVGQAEAVPTTDKPVAEENEIVRLLHPFFADQAAGYQFFVGSEVGNELVLVSKPVMSWKGDNTWFGDVFVWTYEGRPELIGCIGSWQVDNEQRGVFHEFHSLATQPVSEVQIGKNYTWASAKPGVGLQEIAAAPPVAKTRRLRLLQMRRLARDFSASLKSQTGTQVLRMQTPLIRYGENCEQDGAVFPFVWTVGTDPEALLVLESRKTAEGERWFFGAARFTWREVWLQYKSQQVWHAEQYQEKSQKKNLKEAYATVRVDNVSLAELRKYDKKGDDSVEVVR